VEEVSPAGEVELERSDPIEGRPIRLRQRERIDDHPLLYPGDLTGTADGRDSFERTGRVLVGDLRRYERCNREQVTDDLVVSG
jgi:hypothetical protein